MAEHLPPSGPKPGRYDQTAEDESTLGDGDQAEAEHKPGVEHLRRPMRTATTTLANQIGDLVQQLVRQVNERDRRIREVLG